LVSRFGHFKTVLSDFPPYGLALVFD